MNRKAIREGIEMLETKQIEHQNHSKALALESRIKRLVFEEQRAKKLTDIATEKAEKLLKARDRHHRELEERAYRQQQKMEALQQQIEKNKAIKAAAQQKIQASKY